MNESALVFQLKRLRDSDRFQSRLPHRDKSRAVPESPDIMREWSTQEMEGMAMSAIDAGLGQATQTLHLPCWASRDTIVTQKRLKQSQPIPYSSKTACSWCGIPRFGERRGVASLPTKVSFRANKDRWITETLDGASYRTGLADKSYLNGGKTIPRRNRSALELETLRQQLQDREQEIAQLRQATKDKDHKLEQLTSRYRREQMRHYYRQQFMELEPVLEEDSEAEEGSPDSSPSNSPSPGLGNMWNKSPTPNYHEELYLELLKEHTELQHAFQRSQLDHRLMERLDHELVLASAQNKELKKALKQAVAGKTAKVNSKMSAQVQECQAREAALQTENLELREQNELLEFRILELENLSARGSVLDTCDACTDTDGIMDSSESSLYPNRDLMSDADLGVYDLVMDYEHEDLKSRLLQVAKTLQNAPDKSCLLQILALLDSYEQNLDIECLGSLNKSISLGRPRRNLTEHLSRSGGRIIATVFPFKGDLDLELDSPLQEEEVTTKQRSTECLQESGIFEELEYSNQGTQTEDILQPAETPPGNLGEELQKLTRIRERIQERDSSSKLLLIPTDAVGDYNKLRLEALEEKYHEYKSLSTRLQQAEDKVCRLEEEKIRLEKSEDSFRLRCQKLEEELVLLADKEKELESLLEEERLSYQEGFCRILKEKLDKEECADLLQCVIPVLIMYNVWCASKNVLHDQCRCTKYYKLLGDSNTVANNPELAPKPLYYGFIPYLTSSPDFSSEHPCCKDKLPTQVMYVSDQASLSEEPPTGNENIELELNSILNQLKDNIAREADELHDARKEEIKYKEDIKKLQEELATLKGQKSPRRDSGQELFNMDRKRLENNVDMMASKIKTLENKEKRYLETLRRGEVLINKVKQLYIHKLEDAKRSCLAFEDGLQAYERPMDRKNQGKKEECENDQLRERIIDLEDREKELSKRLQKMENEKRKLKTDINDLQADLDMSREAREDLKKNIDGTIKLAVLKEKKITQKLQDQVEELRQELANLDKKQKQKINELKKQLNEAHKEIVNCDCTISELREEVETLETTISNLTHSLEHQLQLEQVLRANLEQLTAERDHELEQARLRVMTTPNVQQELRESQISAAMKSFELEKQRFKQSSFKRKPMEMKEDLNLIPPESSEPHFYELGVAAQDPESFQVYSDYRERETDPKIYEVRAPGMGSFFEEAAHVEAPEPELKGFSEGLESNEIKPDEIEGDVTVDLKPSADTNESIFKETLQLCLQAHKKSLESGGDKNNIDPWFESLESLDLDGLWEENLPKVSHEFSDMVFGQDHDVKRQSICPFQEIGGDRPGSYKRDSHSQPDISYQPGIKVRRLSIDKHGQLFYIDTEGNKVIVDSEGKVIKAERNAMDAAMKSQTLDPLWANKPAPEEEKEVASEKLAQILDPSWNYRPAAREGMEKESKTLDPLGDYKRKLMDQERKQVAIDEELQALQTISSETLPILLHQAPKPPEDNYLMHRGQEFVMGQISSKFLPEGCKDAVEITHAVRKDSSGISNITRRLSTAILHVKIRLLKCHFDLAKFPKATTPNFVYERSFYELLSTRFHEFKSIYTDGSKSGSSVGFAFVVEGSNLKFGLPQETIHISMGMRRRTMIPGEYAPDNKDGEGKNTKENDGVEIPALPAIPTTVEEEIASLLLDSEESDADTRPKEPLEQMLSASPLNYKATTPKPIDGGVTALKSRDCGIPTNSPYKIQDTTGLSKPTSAPPQLRGVAPFVGLKSQEDRVTFQRMGVTSLPTFKPPDVSVSSLQAPRIPDITGAPLSSPNSQDYKKTIGAPRPCYCPPLVPTSKIETFPMSPTLQQMRTPAPVISSVSGPQGISGDKELQAPASSLKPAPLDEDEAFLQDERLDCFQINVGPHHPVNVDDEDQVIPQDERLDCYNIDVGPHFYNTEEEFKGISAMISKCKSPAPRGSSQFPYKTTSTLSKTKAYHDFSESSVRDKAKDTAGDLNKFCALGFDTEERPGSSLKPHVSLLEETAQGVRLADEEFCIKSIIYETTHDTPAGPIPESVPVSEDLDFNDRVSAEDVDFGSNGKSVLEPYVKPCDFTDSQIEQSFYSALSHQTLGSQECVFPDFTIPRPILLPTLPSEVKDTLRDRNFLYRLKSTEYYPIKGDNIVPADIRLIEQVRSAPSPPQGSLIPKYTESVQLTAPFNYPEHYITSPSKVNGESKRSMTSDLGCKVICWDETLEKKSRFTLQELSQCDILCWGLDHDSDNFGPKLIPSRGQPESFYKSDQPKSSYKSDQTESFYKSDQPESFYKSDQPESFYKVGQPGSIPETNKRPRKISVVIDVAKLPPSPAVEDLDTVEVLTIDSTHEELYHRLSAESVNFGDDGDCILETYKDNFIFTDEQLEEAFYTSLPEEKLGSHERMFTECFPQYKQLPEPTVPRTPPPTPVPLISEVENVLSAKEHPLLKLQHSINSSMDCHILCWDEAFIDELMTAPIPDLFPFEDVQSDFECKVLCWAEESLESKSSLLSLAKSSLESLKSISSEIGCRVVCWAERLGVVKKSKEPVGIAPLPSASTCEFLCWDYEEESRGAPKPVRQLESYYSWEEVEYASITPREGELPFSLVELLTG
uniref:Janus kinase and microtubule-interacting protein C-terminal domain-containing protein n=1 Tax=Timema douglasi TaxID=61478 RepID=A0A7R8Z6J9_TIMDO|nr:unnamed protein product [Timema douglasi]